MTKLITIDYDEYLDLIKYKEMIEETKVGGCYFLKDSRMYQEDKPTKVIFSGKKLYDYLMVENGLMAHTVELIRGDKHE